MSSSSGLFLTIKQYVKYGGLLLTILKGGSLGALLLEKTWAKGSCTHYGSTQKSRGFKMVYSLFFKKKTLLKIGLMS
jgi:hypothetical protein